MSHKMKINAERVNYTWKEEVVAVLFEILPNVPFVNEYDIYKSRNLTSNFVTIRRIGRELENF